MFSRLIARSLACGALFAGAASADITYNFENLALNTAVTTQYDGVTISVQTQSCSGSPTLYMRIKTPTGGTSSGTKALQIDTGCPDFSPDYLRMVFDVAQDEVSFRLGDFAGTYQVRAYSTTSGTTGLLSTQNITLAGTGYVGVFRDVHVINASSLIRRVEVENTIGLFETIDDLTFQPDPTPPVAVISSPTPDSCVCTTVIISGTANDPDGTYLRDQADYRGASDTAWTLIGTATTPQTDGILYSWNTTGLTEGLYFIRLTVENTTGLSSNTVTSVWVSRDFDTVTFKLPGIVGGTAHPDGTVWDNWCGASSYTVDYAVLGSGSYLPVDPDNPTYTGSKINEELAVWDTPAVDGSYTVRVRGTNGCSQSLTTTQNTIVDNTAPIGFITSPATCAGLGLATSVTVRGTATDTHLAGWSLQYTGGPYTAWMPIANGVGPVVNAVLGTWNTAALPRCAYTLRLVVTDSAVLNGNDALHNQTEHLVTVDLGCDADYNRSGAVSVQDIFDFLAGYFAGCP